ncbi:nucleolar GTP-binding protein 2-like [Haliotis asinina]|uniref:nucleolar GTP-binding protein 2-like n=1 Tax=Haliotis asinina TaxID=109174 RepID=UPI0035318951
MRGLTCVLSLCLVITLALAENKENAEKKEQALPAGHAQHDALGGEKETPDGERNKHRDHEAVLGSREEALEADDLTPVQAKNRLEQLAKSHDLDKDGKISKEEFITWIMASLKSLDEEEALKMLAEQDGDGDGKLTFGEFLKQQFDYSQDEVKAMRAKGDPEDKTILEVIDEDEKRFTAADLDKDGALDKSEYVAFVHPYDYEHMHAYEVQHRLKDFDKDNDTAVSLAEFLGDRVKGGGGHNMRDKSTIKRLQMYKNFKAKRDRKGKILSPAPFQSTLASGTVARVEPNRRWFGNTRVVTQTALQTFQNEMAKVKRDPYKVVMQQTKLPITLLNEAAKHARVHLLDTESFQSTFGKKSQRKRPNLKVADMSTLLQQAEKLGDSYDITKDHDLVEEDTGVKDETPEIVFKAGQSKRIWNELYKVIDSSDVVVQVLDARDPLGTRCYQVEKYLKKEKAHKNLIFVLNKVDLVPIWVTQKWVAILSAEHPTMAFHASITNPFGKGALINLLRQFGKLHIDKKQISVGFIGYPNVGKSSIINTLKAKKVCKVAPIAGETKVWQYVTLMKRIFLVDCPGVVYPTGATQTEIVLKGVVRVENIRNPEDYIGAILERVKTEYINKTYKIDSWTGTEDFIEQIARKSGRLLKGGEPDISTMAKMILNDWQRGKIPYFVRPPESEDCSRADSKDTPTPTAEVKDTGVKGKEESVDTEVKGKVSGKTQPKVMQDLKKIRVVPTFEGDDVQDIEEDGGSGVEEEEDNEGEGSMEEEDSDVEDSAGEDDALGDSDAENGAVVETSGGQNHSVVESSVSPNKSSTHVASKSVIKSSKKKQRSSARESTNVKSESGKLKMKQEEKQPAESEVNSVASGKWTVTALPAPTSTERRKPAQTGEGCLYDMKVTPEVTCIEVVDPGKQGQRKQAKKRKLQEESQQPLNSKQRRRLERQARKQKIGVHFYSESNVKNRSYR